MPNPDDAQQAFEEHRDDLTDEQFLKELGDASENEKALDYPVAEPEVLAPEFQLVPAAPRRSLPLKAYLATALSGLSEEQRDTVARQISVIKEVCEGELIEPYFPGDHTDPVNQPHIPAGQVFQTDRDQVKQSDLLIWLGPTPSLGVGQELDIAYHALVPILILSPDGATVSRMVLGIPSLKVELSFADEGDLEDKLQRTLLDIRPRLEARKMAFADFDVNIVGEKIRQLRRRQKLTRDQVAEATGIEVEALISLEESTDRVADPSLVQLRMLASVLNTTVGDLVEPNLGDQLISAIQEWVESRMQPARFPGMSQHDRNRMVRRILLRVVDRLER